MGKLWEPLLATTVKKEKDWGKITWPLIGQKKFDGLRVVNREGPLLSRKLELIPNRHCQAMFGTPDLIGLDGELIHGAPNHPDVYRISNSAKKLEGPEDVDFYVWDDFTRPELGYFDRYEIAAERVERLRQRGVRVILVENFEFTSREQAIALSSEWEADGYEGGMGKNPKGRYKFGRSTASEHLIIKFKSWEDQEGKIIGFEELDSNQNEATTDARGKTKRSGHKENQVPMGTLGSLVFETHPEWAKREAKCGSGFTAAQRQEIWDNRDKYLGQVFTFKFQRAGSFERPRFPIFKRFRLD